MNEMLRTFCGVQPTVTLENDAVSATIIVRENEIEIVNPDDKLTDSSFTFIGLNFIIYLIILFIKL